MKIEHARRQQDSISVKKKIGEHVFRRSAAAVVAFGAGVGGVAGKSSLRAERQRRHPESNECRRNVVVGDAYALRAG